MTPASIKPLRGLRILSLALNVPGPSALMRLRAMGAICTKLEPPAGDPMGVFNRAAYGTLHEGVEVLTVDLRGAATELKARGRHDPCVVPRAVVIVEAMAALVLVDHWMRHAAQNRTFKF